MNTFIHLSKTLKQLFSSHLLGLCYLFSACLPTAAHAQIDFAEIEISALKVTDNIHMLQGAGGNIGVFSGADGIFLVDDQYAPLSDKIITAIEAIADGDIRFLVNTHWHGDHTGGNENFGKRGVVIAAHDNVYQRLSTAQHSEVFNRTTPAAPKKAWPLISYSSDMSFHLNGDHLSVMHLANAHTDGDSVIIFKQANVMHTGDIFFSGAYPFIDISSGGSIHGIIAAVDALLGVADANTKIIPGHGPLSSKQDLEAYRSVLLIARDRVQELIDEGMSAEQVIAARPLAEYDDQYGQGFMKPDVFLSLVYRSLLQSK